MTRHWLASPRRWNCRVYALSAINNSYTRFNRCTSTALHRRSLFSSNNSEPILLRYIIASKHLFRCKKCVLHSSIKVFFFSKMYAIRQIATLCATWHCLLTSSVQPAHQQPVEKREWEIQTESKLRESGCPNEHLLAPSSEFIPRRATMVG